jgi:heme-degrading monooxygenase HmoA
MYGSVSRWRVKEGKQDELERLVKDVMAERPPGSRAVYVYHSDADPQEYWVAGVFESREAYQQNSSTPEQGARFAKLRELMETDPEWHDGEIVIANA